MEILTITHKYPPSIGGMQKQSYELIRNLQSVAKVHTLIFSNKYPKALFFLLAVPLALSKLLLHRNIRLIHANDGLMALILTPLLFLTGRKLAVTIHGLDVIFPLGLYQYWVKKYLTRFDLIIAVSAETRQECIRRGIPPERVFYVPNGFELRKATTPPDPGFRARLEKRLGVSLEGKKILLSVGRPIKRKGFGWFVENVAKKITIPYVYLIIGPGQKNLKGLMALSRILSGWMFEKISLSLGLGLDQFRIEKSIRQNALADKVFFLGKIPGKELDQHFVHADLFVMPNLEVKGDYEGFGLVAIEAASAGKVCVAAGVDGIPSAVKDGLNGILLPPEDDDAWAKKIHQLLKDPSGTAEKGKEFRQYTEKNQFTWNMMAREYLKLFDRVCG